MFWSTLFPPFCIEISLSFKNNLKFNFYFSKIFTFHNNNLAKKVCFKQEQWKILITKWKIIYLYSFLQCCKKHFAPVKLNDYPKDMLYTFWFYFTHNSRLIFNFLWDIYTQNTYHRNHNCFLNAFLYPSLKSVYSCLIFFCIEKMECILGSNKKLISLFYLDFLKIFSCWDLQWFLKKFSF